MRFNRGKIVTLAIYSALASAGLIVLLTFGTPEGGCDGDLSQAELDITYLQQKKSPDNEMRTARGYEPSPSCDKCIGNNCRDENCEKLSQSEDPGCYEWFDASWDWKGDLYPWHLLNFGSVNVCINRDSILDLSYHEPPLEQIPNNIGDIMDEGFSTGYHPTRHINLMGNNLSGNIPESICDGGDQIWHTNVIILAHNNLIGQVPSCICDESSPNLEQFNVFDNKLCPPYPTCTATGEGTIDGELWGYCANNGCQTFPGQVVDDYYPGQTDDQGNPEDEPVTCYDCDESDLDDCNVCYGDNICPPPLYMENGVWCTYEPDSNPDNVTWSGSNFDECGVCLGTCEYDGTGCEGSPCVDECNVPNGIGRGDLNRDGGWNVNDILKLIDCVLTGNCSNDWLTWEQARCVADINSDGSCGVLDIVTLVNCVLAENCGR